MKVRACLVIVIVFFAAVVALIWAVCASQAQELCSGGYYSNYANCITNCGHPCTPIDPQSIGWPAGYVVYRCCIGTVPTATPASNPPTLTTTPQVKCGTCYGSQANCNINCLQGCVKVDASIECGWGVGSTAYRCCQGPTRTATPQPTATNTPTPRPTPVPGSVLKGASVIGSCQDVETLQLDGWWLTWSYPPSPAGCGGIGMVCCRGSTISASTSTEFVFGPNEPNLQEQGNMTLQELVAKVRYIETQRPNGKLVSPGLFMYAGFGRPDYTYTYTDIVTEYRRQFGQDPRWVAVAVHGYSNDPQQILLWLDHVSAELDDLGLAQEIWLTEFGAWPGCANPEWVMRGVIEGLAERPRVTRYAWFPASWPSGMKDSAGVTSWGTNKLVEDNGQLTELGSIYVGY